MLGNAKELLQIKHKFHLYLWKGNWLGLSHGKVLPRPESRW